MLVCMAGRDICILVRSLSLNHGMEWEFRSPDGPLMNGATESLVKSVQRALSVSINDQILSFSELQTVMFECPIS